MDLGSSVQEIMEETAANQVILKVSYVINSPHIVENTLLTLRFNPPWTKENNLVANCYVVYLSPNHQ